MSDLPIVERFRAPLLAATPRRRPRLPAAAAGTAAAVLVAAAALVTGLVRSGAPALAVTTSGGVLELRIEDATAGADELTRDLRAAGVDASVRTIAVVPERAGTWILAAEFAGRPCSPPDASGRGPEEITRLGDVQLGDATIRVAVARVRESTGRFVFYAGRAARAGEPVVDTRAALDQDLRARPGCPSPPRDP
jgi:hypothetical protein